MNKFVIEQVMAGQVREGDWITDVDTENLTDVEVNQQYDANDGAWEQVVATGGYADIGWLDLANEQHARRVTGSWDQMVWRRVRVEERLICSFLGTRVEELETHDFTPDGKVHTHDERCLRVTV